VAYFSPKFGLTECLSIFAGGLGRAGRRSSEVRQQIWVLPLVGVGLLYQQGYFSFNTSTPRDGSRQSYEDNDFQTLPLTRTAVTVEVAYPGRTVTAQVWRAASRPRVAFLLDSNLPANRPEDRVITHQLYGGDLEMRLKTGDPPRHRRYRALEALGLEPTVYHMNGGHSAL